MEDTAENLHKRRVDDLGRVFAMLVGKRFADLRESELRILYAWELWGDGMDLDQIFTEMNWNMTNEKNQVPLAEVRQQLTDVFGYEDDELIQED
jgi:inhibitor of KinA sporulation pathway (predicted exonuclease)